jgi:hypothetical protein
MLTQDRVKELFVYSPITGVMTRRIDWYKGKKGDVIGSRHNHGYLQARVDGRTYLIHRLAFLYMEGDMPEEVDHVNGKRDDNRWDNLRPCTKSTNALNSKRSSRNKSGAKGVHWCKRDNKWIAKIHIGGVSRKLGYFDSLDEAAELVQLVREEAHGEFARH